MLPRCLIYTVFTLVLGACAPTQSTPPPANTDTEFRLRIAHINDTHSAFDPVAARFMADEQTLYSEFGGHPRLKTQLNAIRDIAATDNANLLVLHGGDAWQGSAYFKINEGRMNAEMLSRLGIDAMALGNHEFDLNNALLADFISTVNFPVLAANIDASDDAALSQQTNLLPYQLYQFAAGSKTRVVEPADAGGDYVAVFGLVLDDMPNIAPNTGDVRFLDMVSSAQATVDELHAMGVDKIIALTHVGHAVDLDIARQVNGIDVIVGGHSHTLLGDFSDLGLGQQPAYAKRVTNPDQVGSTCVVQAGEYAQAVGELQINFNTNGHVLDCEGGNTLLSDDRFYSASTRGGDTEVVGTNREQVLTFIEQHPRIALINEDPAMRARIDAHYLPAVEEAYGKVISVVAESLTHVRQPGADQHGSQVAPIIAQAQYQWAASDEVAGVAGLRADLALVGAGGIRSSIPAGPLREGDITLELLPFANFMSIVPLRGSVIKAVITDTINATLPDGAHAGKFPYPGNLRYTFTETVAGDQGELTVIEINRGSLQEPKWEALEDNVLYNVAMNSYNATGNDGWNAVFEAQSEQSDRVDLAYVNDDLTAFAVKHISTNREGSLRVHYETRELNCDAQAVQCNTDARAVVEAIASRHPRLTPLPYPVVTLIRQ
ncbi:bifunctional metallophosphatase/5'-nucleotidase [Aliidiomarina sp. Khilg15.8]